MHKAEEPVQEDCFLSNEFKCQILAQAGDRALGNLPGNYVTSRTRHPLKKESGAISTPG